MTDETRTEARRLCMQARRLLEQAREQAKSAENWGVVDLLGGGFASSLVKHSCINGAQSYLDQARALLRHLSQIMAEADADLSDLRPACWPPLPIFPPEICLPICMCRERSAIWQPPLDRR